MKESIKVILALMICSLFLSFPNSVKAQENEQNNVKVIQQDANNKNISRQKLREASAKLSQSQPERKASKLKGKLTSPDSLNVSRLKSIEAKESIDKKKVTPVMNTNVKGKSAIIKNAPKAMGDKRIERLKSKIAETELKINGYNQRLQDAERKAIQDKTKGDLSIEEFDKKMKLINEAKEKASKLIIKIEDGKSIINN